MQETFPGKENPRLRSGEVSAGDLAEAVLEFYIEGEDDLIGLLAYALYERQKRDFIVSHRKRNAGRSPNDAEIAAVTSNYLSADLRNTLRDRASQIREADDLGDEAVVLLGLVVIVHVRKRDGRGGPAHAHECR